MYEYNNMVVASMEMCLFLESKKFENLSLINQNRKDRIARIYTFIVLTGNDEKKVFFILD